MVDKLALAINVLWLWCCLVPALLGLAVLMIGFGKNALASPSYEGQEHKHNWRRDSERSTFKIPEHKSDSDTDKKLLKLGVIPSHHYGIFRDVLVCDECGEEREKTERAIY